MRFGRHKQPASDPLELTEFAEAMTELETQIRDIVDRLESTARSAGQVVLRARRSKEAALRTKGGDGDRAQ